MQYHCFKIFHILLKKCWIRLIVFFVINDSGRKENNVYMWIFSCCFTLKSRVLHAYPNDSFRHDKLQFGIYILYDI